MDDKVKQEKSITCPKCGFENLSEASFCIKCGTRIDGKVPCPKCGEYIPNDVDHCPKCGKAIPHKKSSDQSSNQKLEAVKERAFNIFSLVSCFVSIVLFALIITAISLHYLLDVDEAFQNATFFPTSDLAKLIENADGILKSQLIITIVILAFNYVLCLVFSIIGIVKTARCFRNRSLINEVYKYFAIVLATIFISSSLLRETSYDLFSSYFASFVDTVTGLAVFHLAVSVLFDCFLKFEKGKVSIFIARFILGVGLFIPFIILGVVSTCNLEYFADTYRSYGFIECIIRFSAQLVYDHSALFISTYVVHIISSVFLVAVISISYSFVIYLFAAYFNGLNKFRKFRIAFYMLVISLSIVSGGYLLSAIVEMVLYQRYLGEAFHVELGGGATSIFFASAFLVGVAIATFNIYNRASRRAKLEEKTKVVE